MNKFLSERVVQAARISVGPQIFDTPIVLATFVLSLLIRFTQFPGDKQPNPWQSVIYVFLAHIACYVWLLAVVKPMSRLKGRLILIPAVAILFIGLIRGAVLQLMIEPLHHFFSAQLLLRIATGTIVVGFGMLALSYVLGLAASRVFVLRELRKRQNSLAVSLATNQATIDRWLHTLVADVQQRLRKALAFKPNISAQKLKGNIDRVINDLVRPISNNLVLESPAEIPPVPEVETSNRAIFKDVIKLSLVSDLSTHPTTVSIVVLLWTLVPASRYLGWPSMLLVFIPATTVWFSLWLVGWFMRQIRPRGNIFARLALYLILVTLAGYPSALFAIQRLPYNDEEAVELFAVETSIVAALISLAIALATATYRASLRDQRKLETVNRELKWLVARTRAQMWELQRNVSKVLHGPVQSTLSAAAIRLDMAAKDSNSMPEIIHTSMAAINDAIDVLAEPDDSEQTLRLGLEKVAEGWKGICTVSLDMPKEVESCIDADTSATRVALDLMQEAISNAVRHGNASFANVAVEMPNPSEVSFTVKNDGKPAPLKFKAGLGTNLLEECTLSWSRVSGKAGTTLTCRLPISSALVSVSAE